MNTTELRSLATRRLLAGLFFVIMAATPFIAHAAPTGEGWNGKIADKIEKAAELAYLAQQVNAGGYVLEFSDGSKIDNASEITKRGFSGYYFSLSDDIKLEGGNWIPIGCLLYTSDAAEATSIAKDIQWMY